MKEIYQSPQILLVFFDNDEEVKTIIKSTDGNDILAAWLRGED